MSVAVKPSLAGALVVLLLVLPACMLLGVGGGEPDRSDEEIIFTEGQKAMEAKDYAQAISHFETYAREFPESRQYTWALQRLGESYEGLLDFYYTRKIAAGRPEPEVRKEFLSRFGQYKCWTETPAALRYNRMQYKRILDKYPDSEIADEAAYRMIDWEKDYQGRPDGALREIAALEQVLSRYPTTTLKSEILYKIARRCRMLYEMYAFSPKQDVRDPRKAAQYHEKTRYVYRLCLDASDRSDYGQKAWDELASFERGGRMYILQ